MVSTVHPLDISRIRSASSYVLFYRHKQSTPLSVLQDCVNVVGDLQSTGVETKTESTHNVMNWI